MKIRVLFTVSLATVLAISAAWSAGHATVYDKMLDHYEAVRQALLHDSTDGVAEHARAMQALAHDTGARFDPGEAGVKTEQKDDCLGLLPEIEGAAGRLAAAGSLKEAREAFSELTKPLVRYRKMAGDEGSEVVYCAMAKKAWLQPSGEIGNPYTGQAMPTCGQVVSE
jgi:hypothetical protein